MIVGVLKSDLNFTFDTVLHDLSYQNLVLLSSAIPSYDFDSKKRDRAPGNRGSESTKVTTNKTGLAAIIDTTRKALAGKQ